jgi:Type IV secretion system pilin
MKNFKKIGAILFLGALLFISAPALALDVKPVNFTPQISIPGSEFQQGVSTTVGKISSTTVTSDLLARYVAAFYNWGLSIVGVIAVLMLMAGGIIWLTSGGDSGKINDAKKMIEGSLLGTFLLVGAYFFLNTINPDLTKLPVISMDVVNKVAVENSGFESNAEKIAYACLSGSLTCANTVPPSLNVDLQACYNKFGQLPNKCIGTDSPNRFCCGINSDTQAKANIACTNKANGTACKINETATNGTGYCLNNKCKQCTYFGLSCTNSYECLGGSLLQCGFGDAPGITYPSNCNSGFCAGQTVTKENDTCGANFLGKCLGVGVLNICPGDTSAYSGGSECGSGLKCCK